MQAKTLTNERRFEHNAAPVVLCEHHVDGLTYVSGLCFDIFLEPCGVKIGTRTVLQSLVGEV